MGENGWTIFWTAVSLVFILEGVLPFVYPRLWRRMMLEALQLPENGLRMMGLTSLLIGTLIILLLG
ncbi:hypothetical protein SAMN05443662_0872 [Sulfurivirga caldicuralii]|uniref:DUF2065 domain-containing protein n=1 Tax=Sulfurivirga caldicuralii TaxID=364032 RepID=A0A1N6F1J1_9GAMM|nr:DUF2065 domain-containing protein [Sulfurivirga caldicuralii]SIN89109.1 hypothetical protein SAMN05443662_0872 [Sulfurivirga caldicuralii]